MISALLLAHGGFEHVPQGTAALVAVLLCAAFLAGHFCGSRAAAQEHSNGR